MVDSLNKGTARNLCYGGGLLFLLQAGLIVNAMSLQPKVDNRNHVTDPAARTKPLWDNTNRIGCQSTEGECVSLALYTAYDRYAQGNEVGFKQYM